MSDDARRRPLALNVDTWRHFVAAVRSLATSEVRGQAAWLFGWLLFLLLLISGLNVLNSYVGRDFMTAIEQRDARGFVRETVRYLAVFGALTVAAVLFRFAEERLGLLWREWLTRRIMFNYLDHRVYYRLQASGALPNPDQRITDDVRAFTVSTLSLLLMVLNGTITVRGVLRRAAVDQPAPVRRRRRLCGRRLAADHRARPAADPAQLRPVGPRSETSAPSSCACARTPIRSPSCIASGASSRACGAS